LRTSCVRQTAGRGCARYRAAGGGRAVRRFVPWVIYSTAWIGCSVFVSLCLSWTSGDPLGGLFLYSSVRPSVRCVSLYSGGFVRPCALLRLVRLSSRSCARSLCFLDFCAR
jgi:hypothetical protein